MLIPFHLKTLTWRLLQGDILIYPTDTVYGLISCCLHQEQIKKLNLLKLRPSDQPIAFLVNNEADLTTFAKLNEASLAIWRKYNNQKISTTIIFPIQQSFRTKYLPAKTTTIAARLTLEPNLQKIISITGPLLATSANLHNKPSVTDPYKLAEIFPQQDIVMYQEPYQPQKASRIYSTITKKWLR